MTSPTIRRDLWARRNIETSKYKENLHHGKCKIDVYVDMCLDYSEEASKIIGRLPKFVSAKPFHKTSIKGKIYKLPRQF
jgi:hypothetical protein